VGEDRYAQLVEKRNTSGLSDEEADELGRLIAERKDEPYGGAEARSRAEELEDRADQEGRRERAAPEFEIKEGERAHDTEER
jgi:hypothetical protein